MVVIANIHTMFCFNRCLVDSGFAHIRKLFRRSDVDSLPQLEMLINKSASTNEAVPFQTGTWQWRDWKAFLSRYFTALRGIRQFHHFRFTAETPWFVYVKERIDKEEKGICLKKMGTAVFDATHLPEQIIPPGLSRERPLYLYKTVRPYVRPAHQEALCPTPTEE